MSFINLVTKSGGGSEATPSAVPIFGPSGTLHAPGWVPDPGSTAGSTRYLREDGTWSAPGGGSGGLADAPNDGGTYARKSQAWIAVQSLFIAASQIGAVGGVASLDGTGKVPIAQIPTVPYSQLSGTPTIPAAQVNSEWLACSKSARNRLMHSSPN